MTRVRIAIAQVAPADRIDVNLRKALAYIRMARERMADLVCFPETHLSGYRVGVLEAEVPVDEAALADALAAVADEARREGIAVCIGTETPVPGGKPFNSAVVIDSNGSTVATHHKTMLTPRDELAYSAGTSATVFELFGVRMGIVICFEGFRFPEKVRDLARAGAQLVLHPQFNHVLPDAAWKLPVHEALIVARAAENTIYFVTANMAHPRNNCRSLVIAPNGIIEAASELGREMLLVADIDTSLATRALLRDDPAERMKILAEA